MQVLLTLKDVLSLTVTGKHLLHGGGDAGEELLLVIRVFFEEHLEETRLRLSSNNEQV